MIIKNATIIDGTGSPRHEGDVRIEGELIKEIGKLKERRGEEVLDVGGNFLTPGFIDILNHADTHLTLFTHPSQNALVHQGVTSMLVGHCGASLAPLVHGKAISAIQKWTDLTGININWHSMQELLDELARRPLRLNVGTLVGHTTLRRGLVHDEFRPLHPEELQQMQYLLDQSLEAGAFGLSLGLEYSHAKVAPREEIETLVRLTQKYNGLVTVHLRNESADLTDAVEEVIQLGQKTGAAMHISHFKAMGKGSWQQFTKVLGRLDEVRATLPLTFDSYPYTRTASVFYAFLPEWVAQGGKQALLHRLRDKGVRERIIREMQASHAGYEHMTVASGRIDPLFAGKTFGDIGRNQGISAEEAALNMLLAAEDRLIVFTETIHEENLRKMFEHPACFVASDASGHEKNDRESGYLAHPRSFGAFPRFFAEYVRAKNLLSWEEAIAKASLEPAQKIGLSKRGCIAEGWYADMLVFDPVRIQDRATFEMPYQYAQGIDFVWVNGQAALRNGKTTKERHGKVLRKGI